MNFDEIKVIMDKIKNNIDAKENKLQTIERFIEKYIPITIQSQISETLGAVLTRPFLNKLEHFEQEKFKTLNEDVLSDNAIGLNNEMKALLEDLVNFTQKFTLFSQKKSSQAA